MIEMQTVVLRGLLTDEEYLRKTIPYIKNEYFVDVHSKLFKTLTKYVAKYNKIPTEEAFLLATQDDIASYSEDNIQELNELVPEIFKVVETDSEWLLTETERWCKDRAIYNAAMRSFQIINKETNESEGMIPEIWEEALSVTFDANVGHDYLDNWDERYEFYHEDIDRMAMDIDYLNKITKGGLIRKTLNVLMAGTGVGKSLCMCHMAAGYLSDGYNVLYITGEMAEERIAERIDGNLFDVPIDQLETLSKDMFKSNVQKIKEKTNGKLIIKEYPTGQAHAGHIRALINELRLKKNFVPDIIFLDYLNIFASSRIRAIGGSVNSYTYIKTIAEEMRGLAVENNVPLVTATQINRGGFSSTDPDLDDTSESWGLPSTADLFIAITTSEDLARMNQFQFKQLKNRYSDLNKNKRFLVGVDYTKMKLYDIPESEQNSANEADLLRESGSGDDIPMFDQTEFGRRARGATIVGSVMG